MWPAVRAFPFGTAITFERLKTAKRPVRYCCRCAMLAHLPGKVMWLFLLQLQRIPISPHLFALISVLIFSISTRYAVATRAKKRIRPCKYRRRKTQNVRPSVRSTVLVAGDTIDGTCLSPAALCAHGFHWCFFFIDGWVVVRERCQFA